MLTRSGFIASVGSAALVAVRGEAVLASGLTAPGFSRDGLERLPKVAYQAYINQTTDQFSTSFGTLTKAGYVLISLDVYGDVGNERYAATWVQRKLPYGWFCEIGLTLNELANAVGGQAGQGYVPVIFGATGDLNNQSTSVVMYQTYNYWWWWLALQPGASTTKGTFTYWDAQYRAQNYDLAALAVYGDAGSPLYLACWSGNATATKWLDAPADSSASLTSRIATEEKAGYRPSLVDRNAHGLYASIYRENNVGPWVEQHEMSAAAFEKLFATMSAKHYIPISLRGGGPTASPVFAAVFAGTDQPIPPPRTLTITGKAVAAYATIESEITKFMQTNGVRAGQLTVAKNGAVQYERAFTWAEAGYPITETTSLFRLASCSKAFVEAAIQTLYDQGKLTPATLVFKRLGFSKPGDARSDSITVQELLDHTGGYDDSQAGDPPDPVFSMRTIAADLGLTTAITVPEFVKWVYSQPLQHAPGTTYAYSNTGYAILSYLITVVSGLPFIEFIQNEVMLPLGVKTGLGLTRTAATLRLAGEVYYDDTAVGFTALYPTSPVLTPAAYGGDGLLYEVAQGASSISTTATNVTTLIHTWLVWGNGKRPAPGNWYWQRDGSMPGTTSVAGSRGNDSVDFCFIFNTRNWAAGVSASAPDDLATTINGLLDKFDAAQERFTGTRGGQPLRAPGDPISRRPVAAGAIFGNARAR